MDVFFSFLSNIHLRRTCTAWLLLISLSGIKHAAILACLFVVAFTLISYECVCTTRVLYLLKLTARVREDRSLFKVYH